MKNTLCVAVAAGLALSACKLDLKLSNKRPKTAAEYCERLRTHFEGAETECAAVTDSKALVMLQAVEASTLRKKSGGEAKDVAFVTYQDAGEPNPQTIGGMFQMLGRQLAAASLLEAANSKARVTVWVVRGEISADGFDKLKADVVGLEPG